MVFVLIRFVFDCNKKKTDTALIVVTTIIASTLTLPYLWFVLPPYIDARHYITIGEFWVFVVEALIYWQVLKRKIWEAGILSLIANVSSYIAGLCIVSFF